jgi:predicted dehydrogenase
MNRREFTKLSAVALAGRYLPMNLNTGANKPVGYAAVGLGTISDIFMRACANSQTAKITALVTGHPDTKGMKYSAMYGVPKTSIYTYETFDRIRENPDVDAIYVGLPNSMHAEYTIRGAQAGKQVLCEKPMAISSAECRKMIDACRQANVKLMIGYRVQFEPMWNQAIEIISRTGSGNCNRSTVDFSGSSRPAHGDLRRLSAVVVRCSIWESIRSTRFAISPARSQQISLL